MVQVKSKSLPDRVMKLIETIAEKEAARLINQYQVPQLIIMIVVTHIYYVIFYCHGYWTF